MTGKQRSEIIRMREAGASYSEIAEAAGISRNTVKSFCSRQGISIKAVSRDGEKTDKLSCKQCGARLHHVPGRKMPKFCCSSCRTEWWNTHPEAVNRRAVYDFVCLNCHKQFIAYGNKHRKYCSHECYIADRFSKPLL